MNNPGTFYAIFPLRGNEDAVLVGVGLSLLGTLITIHLLVGRYVLSREQVSQFVHVGIVHVLAASLMSLFTYYYYIATTSL